MKKATVVVGDLFHQNDWGAAFAKGLQVHGWDARLSTDHDDCDLLVLWGVKRQDLILRQKASGGKVCILERGYVGDRFKWSSVSFGGGLNGRGTFTGPFHDGSRWEKHFAHLMRPWRQRPDRIALILGQVPGDMAIKNANIDAWYGEAIEAYHKAGFEIRFRPHPNGRPTRPIHADLAMATIAVTWNSNSGVDAALEGVPVVAMDEGSMAWDVAGHELGTIPETPDRTAWAHRLAWCQYTREEMENGLCWEAVTTQDARR